MPCIFCLAVFAALAGTITTAVIDRVEERLNTKATTPVRRLADSESVAEFQGLFPVDDVAVPVAVTVYKEYKRARIQILTHDLSREDAEKLENRIADLLDLKIVSR